MFNTLIYYTCLSDEMEASEVAQASEDQVAAGGAEGEKPKT